MGFFTLLISISHLLSLFSRDRALPPFSRTKLLEELQFTLVHAHCSGLLRISFLKKGEYFFSQISESLELENGTKIQVPQRRWIITHTPLRLNKTYVQGYSLIFSTIIMVIVPVMILIVAFVKLYKAIPQGSTRSRTMRIMGVIIVMFLICHLPKVQKNTT